MKKTYRNKDSKLFVDDTNIDEYVADQIDDIVLTLQKKRISCNISLYKLSQMTGLAHTTIMRIENYSTQPTLDALMRIAVALNYKLDLFPIDGEDENTKIVPESTSNRCIPVNQQPFMLDVGTVETDYFTTFVRNIYADLHMKISAESYVSSITATLQKYICLVEESEQLHACLDKVREYSNGFILVIREYYLGQHSSAYKLFSEMLDKYDINYLYTPVTNEQPLYRARKRKEYDFEKKDFFHIPFEKRILVSSQRYSFPGLPCIYAGSSENVCITEIGGSSNSLGIAKLRITSDSPLYLLDLTMLFDRPLTSLPEDLRHKFCELFPLVFLCSTSIIDDSHNDTQKSKKDPSFRPDYIIPQLLLEYIIDRTTLREKTVVGIQYYSVQENFILDWINNDFSALNNNKNIVFPVRSFQESGNCRELEKIISVEQVL